LIHASPTLWLIFLYSTKKRVFVPIALIKKSSRFSSNIYLSASYPIPKPQFNAMPAVILRFFSRPALLRDPPNPMRYVAPIPASTAASETWLRGTPIARSPTTNFTKQRPIATSALPSKTIFIKQRSIATTSLPPTATTKKTGLPCSEGCICDHIEEKKGLLDMVRWLKLSCFCSFMQVLSWHFCKRPNQQVKYTFVAWILLVEVFVIVVLYLAKKSPGEDIQSI